MGHSNCHDVWENDQVMKVAYNANDPIEGLLKWVKDCQMMAVVASNPYSLQQLIGTIIVLVEKMGNYVDEMKEWHKKTPIKKNNWFILRKYLINAYLDKVHGLITAGAHGYHGAAYNATGFTNPEPATKRCEHGMATCIK